MAWNELWVPLCKNLAWVGVMFLLFVLCVLANIIAGTYYHTRHIGEKWSKAQFMTSILRMMAIGVSTALLAVVATVAPLVLSRLGLINEDFGKLVSVSLIIGMYVRGIIKYFKEALEEVDHILENRNVVEEMQTIKLKDPPAEDKPK